MTKLRLLYRHAQSIANQGNATGGPFALIPLSDKGEQETVTFAKSLMFDGTPDLLVCSQNLRSQQTCEIVRKTRYPNSLLEVWDDIQEFHFLDFGEKLTTPVERRPLVDQYFSECDPDRRNPGSESWRDLYNRCAFLNEKLATHPASGLLLCGHGYFLITLLTLRELGFPPISPSLMKLVHTNQQTKPIQNLQSFTLSYPD